MKAFLRVGVSLLALAALPIAGEASARARIACMNTSAKLPAWYA